MSMVLYLASLCAIIISSHAVQNTTLDATVRATDCISNDTHCHCTLKAAGLNSVCVKPLQDEPGKCYNGTCAAGYHCDCDAHEICQKLSTVYYVVTSGASSEPFDCTQNQRIVPRVIVGETSDFHIVAYQEFQLFVNREQISFGTASQYKVSTAEIRQGDVIAVIAKRLSADVYGVKLMFTDGRNETRSIDKNWYASDTYISSWLSPDFDPVANNWTRPTLAATITDAEFDPNVSWWWYNASETVYFRYVLP